MRNNILLILNERGLCQRDLARELERKGKRIDYGYLNKIIIGKVKPSFFLAFGIARILNKKVDDLFIPTDEEIFRNNTA